MLCLSARPIDTSGQSGGPCRFEECRIGCIEQETINKGKQIFQTRWELLGLIESTNRETEGERELCSPARPPARLPGRANEPTTNDGRSKRAQTVASDSSSLRRPTDRPTDPTAERASERPTNRQYALKLWTTKLLLSSKTNLWLFTSRICPRVAAVRPSVRPSSNTRTARGEDPGEKRATTNTISHRAEC